MNDTVSPKRADTILKVAFIDHHLNNYHADTFLNLLRNDLGAEGTEIVAAWESDPTGDDWCAKNGVMRAASLREAVDAADAVMLLAPNNIEAHSALFSQILPTGKPVFLDKMLALVPAEARAIARAAKQHGTPIFSASALRFAVELDGTHLASGKTPSDEAVARGAGDWENYGVHTLSLALALMGTGVRRVIDTGTPSGRTVTLDYGNGRRALVECRAAANEWDVFGWSFAVRAAGSNRYTAATVTDYGGFYANLLREVVAFFRTGVSPVSMEEMLTVPALLGAATCSQAQSGIWLPIDLYGETAGEPSLPLSQYHPITAGQTGIVTV